jgi:hypothetical protein
MDALVAYSRLPKTSDSERKQAEQILKRAIAAGEAALREFEGTEQQLEVAQRLLQALQLAGRFDRWTEVYLGALQEHPTHPFVARLAHDAVRISELAGQQERVTEALQYLSAFPADLAGRAEILSALEAARPCFTKL